MKTENYKKLLSAIFEDKLDGTEKVTPDVVMAVDNALYDMGRLGRVLILKYGVCGGDTPNTWACVGKEMGISSGYASKLGRRALITLRHMKYACPIAEELGICRPSNALHTRIIEVGLNIGFGSLELEDYYPGIKRHLAEQPDTSDDSIKQAIREAFDIGGPFD